MTIVGSSSHRRFARSRRIGLRSLLSIQAVLAVTLAMLSYHVRTASLEKAHELAVIRSLEMAGFHVTLRRFGNSVTRTLYPELCDRVWAVGVADVDCLKISNSELVELLKECKHVQWLFGPGHLEQQSKKYQNSHRLDKEFVRNELPTVWVHIDY